MADTHSSRKKRSRGSAMVEVSLIGVVLFMLLLGLMDFGQFLFLQQALVERARYAARWGAASDPTNSVAIRNMVLYLQTIAPTDGTTPSFGLTSDMVSVSTADPGTDNYRLIVQISGYSFKVISPLLSGSYNGPSVLVSAPLGLYH